jgi:putative protease
VETVTRVWREAIDECESQPARYRVKPAWQQALAEISEGTQCTLGAYHRPWK